MSTTYTVTEFTRKRKNPGYDELLTPDRKKIHAPLTTEKSKDKSEIKIKRTNKITNHFLYFNLAQQAGNGGLGRLGGGQAIAGGGSLAVQGACAVSGSDLARGGKPRKFRKDTVIGQTQSAAGTLPNNGSRNNS